MIGEPLPKKYRMGVVEGNVEREAKKQTKKLFGCRFPSQSNWLFCRQVRNALRYSKID